MRNYLQIFKPRSFPVVDSISYSYIRKFFLLFYARFMTLLLPHLYFFRFYLLHKIAKQGGDKILLPPSAFDTLARLVDYPMLFKLESHDKGTMTHCGVLEFTAEEGSCYIPFWMMQNLLIEEGSLLTVTNASLPKATFVKLQHQHVDFLDIHNPRAVLEHALRSFSCVTKGDVICIPYNQKNYHFMLKEVQPKDAACIIETDCNVDFDAPVGYKEPNWKAGAGGEGKSDDVSIASSSTNNPFVNMPKQSAHGGTPRDSACPSPTGSSISGASGRATGTTSAAAEGGDDASSKLSGIRIENGVIIRADEEEPVGPRVSTSMIASRAGATGVQKNAAIPAKAPQIDYWAVNAGEGARLDGKKPTVLKDKEGNEVDIRKLREAALARSSGTEDAAIVDTSAIVSQRKSRIGNKFSKRKTGVAYSGSANKF